MQVDEQSIQDDVGKRRYEIEVSENWFTPAGNQRKAPVYEAEIENEYLDVSRVIKGRTIEEVESKCLQQLNKWVGQEVKRKTADAKNSLKETAFERTEEARQEIDALKSLLSATLDVDDRIDWDSMMDRRRFKVIPFSEESREEPVLPPKTFFQKLFARLYKPVEERFEAEHAEWQTHVEQRQANQEAHQIQQEQDKERFLRAQKSKNESIAGFRAQFESGEPDAITEYMRLVFDRSSYPSSFRPEHEVQYDVPSNTLVVNVSIAGPDSVKMILEVKPADRNTTLKEIPLKPKDRDLLYDSAGKQTVLRTLHETFEALYTDHVQAAVVNLWTTVVNPATGHEETSCILSVSAEREEFEAINLERVDPTECIKNLKGLIAGPLAKVPPVKPILNLDTSDPRFVESRDVLADFNSSTNLAEIHWEEFEQLVRELFSKLFSGDGAKVEVTQASRDAGVDAIAFDPDPIRGGKFVIQAKRYTKVVSVSAVRDLYGTMMNEGAARGILVTTAHYGRDARSFAKDKPITLIDGSNLVHLLEEHGHQVRIDVDQARANAARRAG